MISCPDLETMPRRLRRSLRRMAFVTTPTSIINRLMGVEAWTDPISLPSGSTIGGSTVDPTNSLVTVPAGTTTLTVTQALHAGKILLLASTGGLAITPPAATGTGALYRLCVITTITGGNVTWDAKAGNASDILAGWIQSYKATTFTPYIANSNLNLVTLDGTTRGGIKGDFLEFRDVATNLWIVSGFVTQSGTIATPFTNH